MQPLSGGQVVVRWRVLSRHEPRTLRPCFEVESRLLGAHVGPSRRSRVNAQGHIPGEFTMFHAQQDAEKFASAYGLEWAQPFPTRPHLPVRLQGETTSAQDWAVLGNCKTTSLCRRRSSTTKSRTVRPSPTTPTPTAVAPRRAGTTTSILIWPGTSPQAVVAADGSRIVVAVRGRRFQLQPRRLDRQPLGEQR